MLTKVMLGAPTEYYIPFEFLNKIHLILILCGSKQGYMARFFLIRSKQQLVEAVTQFNKPSSIRTNFIGRLKDIATSSLLNGYFILMRCKIHAVSLKGCFINRKSKMCLCRSVIYCTLRNNGVYGVSVILVSYKNEIL